MKKKQQKVKKIMKNKKKKDKWGIKEGGKIIMKG